MQDEKRGDIYSSTRGIVMGWCSFCAFTIYAIDDNIQISHINMSAFM